MPIGHDSLRDDAPEPARPLAASMQQRIAFGERAGPQVRRIGAGFGAEGETPTLTSPRCASVGVSPHANTQVPAHWRGQLERLIRSTARGTVSMARCPCWQRGALRLIVAITQGTVIRKILRHLKRAVAPPALRPVWERLRAVGRGRLPGTLPQAGAACQPACGLRAVGRAPGQPPSAGLGRPPVVQGVREGVDVGATGKGALYFLCSSSIREYKNINGLFH